MHKMDFTFNQFIFVVSFLFLASSCADSVEEIPDKEPLVFDVVKMFDINGLSIGCFPECGDDQDWTNQTLTETELGYLDFEDNITLADDGQTPTIESISVFPNPIYNGSNQFISCRSTGVSKIKIAIISKFEHVLFSQAFILDQDINNFQISNEVFRDFVPKYIHRMYYVITDKDENIVFSGWGDMSVCEEIMNPEASACFE